MTKEYYNTIFYIYHCLAILNVFFLKEMRNICFKNKVISVFKSFSSIVISRDTDDDGRKTFAKYNFTTIVLTFIKIKMVTISLFL